MKRIESPNNPLIKDLRRLARPRKRESRFLLEGKKLVEDAITSGIELEVVVVSSAADGSIWPREIPRGTTVVELAARLFARVSSLASPEGILAVASRPASSTLPRTGIVAVAAGVRDPGNLGAIARVVEASGAAGLVVLEGSADPFSPKAARGSMGSVLRIPVIDAADASVLGTFRVAGLVPRGGVDFREADYRSPCAVVLGGESTGVHGALQSQCDFLVSIPMKGAVESLNVATAAALVLYEATRPRV